MKRLSIPLLLVSMILVSCKNTSYHVISKKDYVDKMKAAWIGQMIISSWNIMKMEPCSYSI